MTLKFNCSNCGQDITILSAQKGDIVKCTKCGSDNVVPENIDQVADTPDPTNSKLGAETTAAHALGPRKLDAILSETWRIYGKHYLKLWAFAAVLGVINLLVFGIFYPASFILKAISDNIDMIYVLPYVVAGIFLFVTIFLIVNLWVQCALIYVISLQYFDRNINFSTTHRFVWQHLGTAILTQGLAGLAMIGLSLTIIGIPVAIYLGAAWSFVLPAVLLEKCSPTKALGRSFGLVKGNWWRVFGINFIFGAIAFGLGMIVGLIPVIGTLSVIITLPITVLGNVLLYFDLRARKEGYTIENLNAELH